MGQQTPTGTRNKRSVTVRPLTSRTFTQREEPLAI